MSTQNARPDTTPSEDPAGRGGGAEPGEGAVFVYRHDPGRDSASARSLDAAYADGWDWPGAADAVRGAVVEEGIAPDEPLGVELVRMALFELHLAGAGGAGCQLGPQWETEQRAYPIRVADASIESVTLWRACARLCSTPGAVARANDLLWERRDGRPADHARRAVQAYLELATSRDVDRGVAQVLVRAWDIACRVGDWELVAAAEEALLAAAEAGLRGDDYVPGAVLPMLATLCAKPAASRLRKGRPPASPPKVSALLETAFATYTADHLLEEIASLMRARTSSHPERVAVDQRLCKALLELAESRTGLAKQQALSKAIEAARARGLPDLAAEGTRRLQRIRSSDLGLQRISVTVPLPADHFERMARWGSRGRSWREALTSFLTSGPPTGTVDELRRMAADHASQSVVRQLLTRVMLNREGFPVVTTGPEDAFADLAYQAEFTAGAWSQALAEGLRRIADHHGAPGDDDLLRYLCDMGAGDQGLAQALADGFQLFWARQFDAAVHLVVPKIEAALRLVLRECDVAIYRTQAGKDPGGYLGLYELLVEVENVGFDPDWVYFLRWLLLGPHGRNLRNDVAHGLISGTGPADAALALRAASLMILLAGPGALPDWDDELDGRPLTSGTTTMQVRSRGHLEWLLRNPTPPHSPRRRAATLSARVLRNVAARADRLATRLSR